MVPGAIWRCDMETKSESSSALAPTPSLPKKPDTSLVSERLTNSEIESLRRNLQESNAWLRREFAKEAPTKG